MTPVSFYIILLHVSGFSNLFYENYEQNYSQFFNKKFRYYDQRGYGLGVKSPYRHPNQGMTPQKTIPALPENISDYSYNDFPSVQSRTLNYIFPANQSLDRQKSTDGSAYSSRYNSSPLP